jgi:uncharacterized repeat protein (TIGR02543 family)
VLTALVDGEGSVSTEPDQVTYHYGDVVTLTAAAPTGWTFAGWVGDLDGTINPAAITMDGHKAVTSTFTRRIYPLTVHTDGEGSVAVDPAGPYRYGDVVTLTADADLGWTFAVWTGDLGGSANPETITIDGRKSVTATLTQNEYTLTVNKQGVGTVDIEPAGPYQYGDVVTLTANASPGWIFAGWGGELEGTGEYGTITMLEHKVVTATFTRDAYTLTVDTVGQGSVSVEPTGTYHYGNVVTLTANADPGWVFTGWLGDLSGTDNPATLRIERNTSVTAEFAEAPPNPYSVFLPFVSVADDQ